MESMKPSIEYQIFVGCDDPQIKSTYINDDELTDLISNYFIRKKVDFSLLKSTGGYLYADGDYAIENGVCISIIGAKEEEILKLSKSLSMYMNQEKLLIVKNDLKVEVI